MNKHFISISLYYSLIFMSAGAYGAYIGLYYTGIGLDTVQIGTVGALSAVVAILVQPYWGLISDRARYKNQVLFLCMIMAAACIWLVPLAGSFFWLIVLMTLVFTVFQCAIFPLSTAVTLEIASQYKFKFSRVRTFGSVGFALMSLITGWAIDYSMYAIFVLYSAIMVLAWLLSFFISKVKGHQRGGSKVKLSEILKNRKLVYIFLFALFIQSSVNFYFSFQAIYSLEQGIDTNLIGLGLMIGSLSQFPFMIFFDRIYKRFGITKILLFSGVVQIIRLLLFAFYLTPKTLLILWVLHGGTVILFSLCLIEYVNATVRPELRASGQMLNAVVMQGLSSIVGSMVGGICAHFIGLQIAFVVYAGVCALAVAGFGVVVRHSVWFRAGEPVAPAQSATGSM